MEIKLTEAMSEYKESGSAEITTITVLSFLIILNIAGNSLYYHNHIVIIKNQESRHEVCQGEQGEICMRMRASAERSLKFAQNRDGYSSASF